MLHDGENPMNSNFFVSKKVHTSTEYFRISAFRISIIMSSKEAVCCISKAQNGLGVTEARHWICFEGKWVLKAPKTEISLPTFSIFAWGPEMFHLYLYISQFYTNLSPKMSGWCT